MGLRIKGVQNGDTPLKIVHRMLTQEMFEQTPDDHARVANDLLSQGSRGYEPVKRIEDLDDSQLAELVGKLLKGLNG